MTTMPKRAAFRSAFKVIRSALSSEPNTSRFYVANYRFVAEPNFTIPLMDRHMDIHTDLTWTCEAFGVPDVSYKWYRNGEPLIVQNMHPNDASRYLVQDNILTIRDLNPERDPAMYQCRARNTLKTRFSSAQLRILCELQFRFSRVFSCFCAR